MRALLSSIAAGVVGAAVSTFAQAPATGSLPAFDAASVKINDSGGSRSGTLGAGMLTQTNVTLKELVQMAYGPRDVSGGSNWVDAERYDIVARGSFDMTAFTPPANGSIAPAYLMLRALLIERFKLAAHIVTEQRNVYALQLARPDKRLGSGMHPASVDCDAVLAAQAKGEQPDLPSAARRPPCSIARGPGRISGNAVSMAALANALYGSADRMIVDQTGLTGAYDVDFEWGEMQAGPSDRPPPPGSHAGDDEPLFTALRNELGLKLEPTRAGVAVVVIDHAEHPTQN